MKNVVILGMDHFGRGIAKVQEKVIFVDDALPGEVVDLEIINDKKRFSEARVVRYIKESDKRIKSICPFFGKCGGCNLLNLAYRDTLDFKLNKVRELMRKNNIQFTKDVEVVLNEQDFGYRNKLSLKIENGKIGFYQEKTHQLVEINKCVLASGVINKVIANFSFLKMDNGSLIIRCNKNDEILLVIESAEEQLNIDVDKLKEKVKLVGIVYNGKLVFGQDFYYERIEGKLFKVSYDAFFQVNPFITKKLFEIVLQNIGNDEVVLDLYSGVGTLGIVASKKASEVISIEVVKNAVIDGILNAKLNGRDNIKFMLGDVAQIVSKIRKKIDTLIVDPPRKGLDRKTKEFIKNKRPRKIIYISCDVNTLMRDLKEIEDIYEIKNYKILDMFSYSYHVECCALLSLKTSKK